jgi:hypothetical protein
VAGVRYLQAYAATPEEVKTVVDFIERERGGLDLPLNNVSGSSAPAGEKIERMNDASPSALREIIS